MPAVASPRDLLTTIRELRSRVARLERYATGTPPMAYALRPAALTYTAVATTTWTLTYAATIARATRGAQAVLSAYADAGTAGEARLRVAGVDVPLLLGAGTATTVPITGTAPATVYTPTVAVPGGSMGDAVDVQVWVRRTSGTGNVQVAGLALLGVVR